LASSIIAEEMVGVEEVEEETVESCGEDSSSDVGINALAK
jgi:hypothetical protein